jgi:hypothetical protein
MWLCSAICFALAANCASALPLAEGALCPGEPGFRFVLGARPAAVQMPIQALRLQHGIKGPFFISSSVMSHSRSHSVSVFAA